MFRIYWPWKNLGCLGIRIGPLYVDIFTSPYLGIYWHWRGHDSRVTGDSRGWWRFWPLLILLFSIQKVEAQRLSKQYRGSVDSLTISSIHINSPYHWTTAEISLAGIFVALVEIDAAQTRHFLHHEIQEINPILGKHPSDGRINTLTTLGVLGAVGMGTVMPSGKWRKRWFGFLSVVETAFVIHNTNLKW